MIVENLLSEIKEIQRLTNGKLEVESFNARDEQMAKNLYWLCNVKYAGKKIIVWAANFHISKYASHYDDKWLNGYKSMGSVFTRDLQMGRKTYVLQFTSYDGTAGRVASKPYKLSTPKPDYFESWIPKDWKYGFVDFAAWNNTPDNTNEPFAALAHNHTRHKAYWSKVTDGFFFIRTMYPCTATVKFSEPKK